MLVQIFRNYGDMKMLNNIFLLGLGLVCGKIFQFSSVVDIKYTYRG